MKIRKDLLKNKARTIFTLNNFIYLMVVLFFISFIVSTFLQKSSVDIKVESKYQPPSSKPPSSEPPSSISNSITNSIIQADNNVYPLILKIKGKSGNEIINIRDNYRTLLENKQLSKTTETIILNPSGSSIFIDFLNDSSSNDVIVQSLMYKDEEIKQNINADAIFDISNPRYNELVKGKLLWKGTYEYKF